MDRERQVVMDINPRRLDHNLEVQMRVLVTGATGFLGKNLIEYLPNYLGRDYKISGIGSMNYDLINQHACRKALEYYNPDVIVHAAGTVGGIGANKENPGKFMYNNLIMVANLIEEARKQMVPKFVVCLVQSALTPNIQRFHLMS